MFVFNVNNINKLYMFCVYSCCALLIVRIYLLNQ